MLATIVEIGANADVIVTFAAGLLGFFVFVAMLVMAVEAIRRFLDVS